MATVMHQLRQILGIMERAVLLHPIRVARQTQARTIATINALRQLLDFLGIMAGVVLPQLTHVVKQVQAQ